MNRVDMLLAVVLVVASAAPAVAAPAVAETPALSLLLSDSLVGWDYGDDLAGWTIHDGKLTGSGSADPLVGGWTLGDFELDVVYSAPTGSGISIGFPVVGDANDSQAIGGGDENTETKNERIRIKRQGGELSYTIEEGLGETLQVGPQKRLGITLAVIGKQATIKSVTLREPAGAKIFNEKDLTGWWTPGKLGAWRVEGNELVKRGGGGNYLRTKKEYANFTLSLEYKISKGGNSGIGIRTKPNGWPSGDGMELQLLDRPSIDKSSTMAIYRNVAPLAVAHTSEDWNQAVVKADGYVISTWINGQLVQHVNTFRHPELKHRHLSGWIGFQDHGGVDQFRNIRLLEAPEGRGGLDRWYRPTQPIAAEMVLDRLMNPETLAREDGLRSTFAAATASGEKNQTLAHLPGPAALVRIGYDQPLATLALYFDGEEQPRIVCRASELAAKLPKLTEANQPCLTCVVYAKSLRIEVEDAKEGATFDFASVALPAGVAAESYVDSSSSIPRGWLDTIDYRRHHHRFGTLREADPLPRQQSEQAKIEPGSAAPLLKLDGAGVVQWLKIQGARDKLLANDDLWLEITVDGEAQPTIFAPARFVMAMVQNDRNYQNFVMLYSGGFTSRLAMPFANGIAIVAHNKGTKPIGPVGASVSYRREANAAAMAGWLRLRGKFLDNDKEYSPATVQIAGLGRIVGLVAENIEGQEIGFEKLTVDGETSALSQCDAKRILGLAPISKNNTAAQGCVSGFDAGLAWRYFLLAPIDFQRNVAMHFAGKQDARHLVLYYAAAEK